MHRPFYDNWFSKTRVVNTYCAHDGDPIPGVVLLTTTFFCSKFVFFITPDDRRSANTVRTTSNGGIELLPRLPAPNANEIDDGFECFILTESDISFEASEVSHAEYARFLESAIDRKPEVGFENARRPHTAPRHSCKNSGARGLLHRFSESTMVVRVNAIKKRFVTSATRQCVYPLCTCIVKPTFRIIMCLYAGTIPINYNNYTRRWRHDKRAQYKTYAVIIIIIIMF